MQFRFAHQLLRSSGHLAARDALKTTKYAVNEDWIPKYASMSAKIQQEPLPSLPSCMQHHFAPCSVEQVILQCHDSPVSAC